MKVFVVVNRFYEGMNDYQILGIMSTKRKARALCKKVGKDSFFWETEIDKVDLEDNDGYLENPTLGEAYNRTTKMWERLKRRKR